MLLNTAVRPESQRGSRARIAAAAADPRALKDQVQDLLNAHAESVGSRPVVLRELGPRGNELHATWAVKSGRHTEMTAAVGARDAVSARAVATRILSSQLHRDVHAAVKQRVGDQPMWLECNLRDPSVRAGVISLHVGNQFSRSLEFDASESSASIAARVADSFTAVAS